MPTWLDIPQIEKTADWTAEDAKNIGGGNMVVIRDHDGDFVPFQIVEADFAAHGTMLRQARCNHLYYELGDGPIRNYNLINAIPSTAIAAALDGTRWQVGNIDDSLLALTKDFQAVYLNPLEMLRLIEREYDARLKFRVTVGDTGITGYYVDLLEIDNEFKGQRFEFGWNLHGIDIKVDSSRIKTALVGIGMGDEIDLETGEPLPLTFKDVEWSIANGDPANKPLGQDWVGDEAARQQHGIYDPVSGEMLHRFGKYESQAETPEGLLWATWQQLQRYHVRPMVNVEAQVADLEQVKVVDIESGELTQLEHEKIRLGNVCYIKAEHKGLIAAVDAKIYRIERYLKREESGQTRVLFGDPIMLGSDYVRELEGKVDWKDKRRRKLDRGRGGQTVTVASEDTSKVPWYAGVIIRAGETVNERWAEIMDLVPNNGGQVLFLEGTYIIDDALEVTRDNVHISGQGEGTVFKIAEGFGGYFDAFSFTDRTGVSVSDLVIDGNRDVSMRVSSGISLTRCKSFRVTRVVMRRLRRSAVEVRDSSDGVIDTCTCLGNGGAGIRISKSETGPREITIRSNYCAENYDEGIEINDATEVVVDSNQCIGNEPGGIMLIDSSNCSILGNTCKSSIGLPGASGIALLRSSNNSVTGNTCNDNIDQGYGIYIFDGNNNTISGNSCCNNGSVDPLVGSGIGVHGNNNTIVGNVCNNNAIIGIEVGYLYNSVQSNKCYGNRYGIAVTGAGVGTLVTNNDLYGNTAGGIWDSGTGTRTTAENRT